MSFGGMIFSLLKKNFGDKEAFQLFNKIKADLEVSRTEREISEATKNNPSKPSDAGRSHLH